MMAEMSGKCVGKGERKSGSHELKKLWSDGEKE